MSNSQTDTNDLIHPPPSNCPGPNSSNAGNEKTCEGCENQQFCKIASKGPDPDFSIITERLAGVKNKILVLSGKGGVGKSTISTQLALYFAQNDDCQVGLMDVDICGPSIPRMMGVMNESVHQSNLGWEPVYAKDNLGIMSIGFLLDSEDEAVIWRGPKKNGMIKQFLKDVYWDELDYLVIDTPPGTSDEHLSTQAYLKASGISGAIVVTTPQELSLLDVRKEINFCKKVNIPIIGVIENMSGFVCPKCNNATEIFLPTTGGAEKMSEEMNVQFLGKIPLNPIITRNCDDGTLIDSIAGSNFPETFKKIFDKITNILNTPKNQQ